MPIISTCLAVAMIVQPQKSKKTPTKPQAGKTTQKKEPVKNPTPQTKAIDRTKAEIGQLFTMGEKGSRLTFKVTDAWYSMNEPRKGEMILADEGEKLLTMRVEIQNPESVDQSIWTGTFGIKVTGANNQSVSPDVRLYDVQSGDRANQSLRPTQKMEALMTFPVTADGPVYKLFVSYQSDTPLVYDFRGKAKDKMGEWSAGDGLVKSEIKAKIGVPFTMDEWQWTVDEVIAPKPDEKDADGNVTKAGVGITYQVRIKNLATLPRGLYAGTCTGYLEDENGQSTSDTWLFFRNTDKSTGDQVQPGKELKLTYIFVPLGAKLTSCSISLHGRKAFLPLP